MADHTTHFDDCGCLSAKLRARAEQAEREVYEARAEITCAEVTRDRFRATLAAAQARERSLRGLVESFVPVDIPQDDSALRALMLEAIRSSNGDETAEAIVDRVLGEDK